MFIRFLALLSPWIRPLLCLSTYGFCLLLEVFWPQASQWLYLLANGLCLIGLYPLCWKAPHPWPIWATGCALLAVMSDILALTQPQIVRPILIWVINLSGFACLLSLAFGAFAWLKAEKHLQT